MVEYRIPYKDVPWATIIFVLGAKLLDTFFTRPFKYIMSHGWAFGLLISAVGITILEAFCQTLVHHSLLLAVGKSFIELIVSIFK